MEHSLIRPNTYISEIFILNFHNLLILKKENQQSHPQREKTMAIKKHIGKVSNTGTNIIVVFREIPGDTNHCLVIEPNRLPDLYHDNIMNIVDSKEAQQTNDFFEVLNRRQFGDGTHCLTTLHTRNYLVKIPVDHVNMEPMPGRLVPLRMINDQIAGRVTEEKITQAEASKATEKEPETDMSVAKGLLAQAELLEAEARKKREEVYKMFPELRPETDVPKAGRPENTETQKVSREIEKAEKRRVYERDQTKKRNTEKKEKAIQEAVDSKIVRDAERLAKDVE